MESKVFFFMKNKKKIEEKSKPLSNKNELIPPLSPTRLFFLLLNLLEWSGKNFYQKTLQKFLIKTETN